MKTPSTLSSGDNTLSTYALPDRRMPVQSIDTGLVLKVLEPIRTTKTETAMVYVDESRPSSTGPRSRLSRRRKSSALERSPFAIAWA